jgi:hypothetical protein
MSQRSSSMQVSIRLMPIASCTICTKYHGCSSILMFWGSRKTRSASPRMPTSLLECATSCILSLVPPTAALQSLLPTPPWVSSMVSQRSLNYGSHPGTLSIPGPSRAPVIIWDKPAYVSINVLRPFVSHILISSLGDK